ncbi:unnamed protein product, partial [Laminaria digitata]
DASANDASPQDAAAPDAQPVDSGVMDAGVPALPTECAGACRDLSLMIDLSGAQDSFQRAYYGLTSPAQSSSGTWELHLEATSGGADGCPTEASPSPDWTLVLAGLTLPLGRDPVVQGLSVSFLDFSGRFLTGTPITRSTTRSVQALAANLCPECVGMSAPAHPEGLVSLNLQASFAEGSIAGQVFATHCDSLDLP